MRVLSPLIIVLLFISNIYSQNASTYFPSNTGYKWFYKNTPLDSLNNPQPTLSTYQIDSFAAVTTYQGLQASKVVSKSGLLSINQTSPYTDTNYYNFQSTNGWYYLNVLSLINSFPLLDSVAFIDFLRSFEDWYSTYRFSSSVNSSYTVFSKDTTVTFDTLTLPLRIATTGRRLADQNVTTINGTFPAKKFLLTFQISFGLLPPFLYVPIVTRPDTVYIASNIWVIKDVMPSINVDLTSLGFPVSFSIPGSLKELTTGPTGIVNFSNTIPSRYSLSQNYPNPFNPSTNLKFQIPDFGSVSLKVFDALGKEVAVLVNENMQPGSYEVNWDAGIFSNGVYYYKLTAGEFSETKKMLLIK
ncbi:MAG: T9SS type A sorting domain-containing protein [bacterium]|nr:T9SS type A sorting domain-containing protein [bacterium]